MRCGCRFGFSVAVWAALIASGCSSSPLSRIDANRALYESWPLDMQEAVLSGRVEPGMTPEMVEMSIGKPAEKVTRPTRTGEEEIWTYRSGGSGLGNTSVMIGGGIGGVNVGGPIGGGGGYQEEFQVVFENGQVTRSDIPQQ